MNHKKVGEMWNENAEVWTKLSRMGYDVYRNYINTPAFLKMLPNVSDLNGLDIGCGEGYNTRMVAKKGAKMIAVDISETFIKHAIEKEKEEPLEIKYQIASALELPFLDKQFDFVMSTMALMDMPNLNKALTEAYRVIKSGGFFQFSIIHPCFFTPQFKWIYDENNERVAILCGDYYKPKIGEVDEWIFSAAPEEIKAGMRKFRIPRFDRILSDWLNSLIKIGFILEEFNEPYANEEIAKKCPDVADTRIFSWFLHIRCRKI